MSGNGKRRSRFRLVHLLLIVPYLAVLWVPFYNSAGAALYGVPFFYWYQMLWIALGALLLLPVYIVEERGAKSE
jgi:predicted ferric reductase